MTALALAAVWEPEVYQLELTDLVEGGPDGIDNIQAKQLGNRTEYLYSITRLYDVGPFDVPAAADPALKVLEWETPAGAVFHVDLEFTKPLSGSLLLAHWESLFVFNGVGFAPSSESVELGASSGLPLSLIITEGDGAKPALVVKMASGGAVFGVHLRWRAKRVFTP